MEEVFVEDYVNKVTFLEEHIGANVGYKPMEPFWVPGTNLRDPYEIQGAARQIADWLGLTNLTFLVTIVKQKKEVAGHIELSYCGDDVYIEVSDDIATFEDAAAATLAHEITHKYMQLSGICLGTEIRHEYEREVLTDIAAVFLGLGKFMLNGCETVKEHDEVRVDGTHHITESAKCGYLNRRQLAFVYRLVCSMRGVSREDMLSNLTGPAVDAVLYCECYAKDYFDKRFGSDEFARELVSTGMTDIQAAKRQIDVAEETIEFLREDYIRNKQELLRTRQEMLTDFQNEIERLQATKTYDPCLRFLRTMRLRQWVSQIRSRIKGSRFELSQVHQQLRCLKKTIQKERPLTPGKKSIGRRILNCIARLYT